MLRIKDGRGERRELLEGVEVVSSGGIPPVWKEIVRHLPRSGRVLDYGSWQGIVALWLAATGFPGEVLYAHNSSTIVAAARENAAFNGIELACRAMFPLEERWDTLILPAPEQGEALGMLAGQAAASLVPHGQVLMTDTQERREELAAWFSHSEVLARGEGWVVLSLAGPRIQVASLPWQEVEVCIRGQEFAAETLPGTFSPGGLDAGTRFMLEEAEIPAGSRVLDLGCGWGVVGLTAAKLGAGEVVCLDEDLIAVSACRRNIKRHGIKGKVVHSHLPGATGDGFDRILINPPYHADYGVAKSFLEFAAHKLMPEGVVYVVVKNPDWYKNKLDSLFGGCKRLERDGYWLLSSRQIPGKAGKGKAKKTTRKHKRRQQAARGGRKHGRN